MSFEIKVLKKEDLEYKTFFGIKHFCYDFTPNEEFKYSIIATMHIKECYTNIEVLKFALFCRKNKIKLTMYGVLNQLPLFSIFADAVILQDKDDWGLDLYPETATSLSCTQLRSEEIFENFKYLTPLKNKTSKGLYFKYLFNDAIELELCYPNYTPLWRFVVEQQITNEDVANAFAFCPIYVREEAVKIYRNLVDDNTIIQNLIMCEAKLGLMTSGAHLLSVFKEATKNYSLPVCTDLEYKKKLLNLCGQDYLAVQMLCSYFSNWMWVCFGGSTNLFSFLPVKILSLFDCMCDYELVQKVIHKRFPEFSDVFPDCETLVYCFPAEKDGPSRTDGHRPLPNLQKRTEEFSALNLNAILN